MFEIFAAPLQGYTESAWRNAHKLVYGSVSGAASRYFTPFIRIERGEVRTRDLKELLRSGPVSAQIIFRDRDEFVKLVEAVTETGCRSIDLNMGCPFPMQTSKGRGAAVIAGPELLESVAEVMHAHPEVEWSAKMRLGMNDPSEWREAMRAIRQMPLRWLTVHPRVASQGYKGDLHLDEVNDIIKQSECPIVYNGEIQTPEDIEGVKLRWPELYGVMIGRGLLARPSLVAEYRSGAQWDKSTRLDYIKQMHSIVFDSYSQRLEGGERQLIQKMMAFWEYLEPEIGHKIFKAIKKSTSSKAYLSATGGA